MLASDCASDLFNSRFWRYIIFYVCMYMPAYITAHRRCTLDISLWCRRCNKIKCHRGTNGNWQTNSLLTMFVLPESKACRIEVWPLAIALLTWVRLKKQQRFTMYEVVANWHELMIPQRIVRHPLLALTDNGPAVQLANIPPPESATLGLHLVAHAK